jgi:alpha-amylase/alpha-mannosidase (GH57 family)
MHQPPVWVGEGTAARLVGNLEKMLDGPENSEERWNAGWYARAYANPARYVERLCAEGFAPRLMLDYSGVLLEELARLGRDPSFRQREVGGEAIGDVVGTLARVLAAHPEAIEFAGTAYSHCYFPATPERDHKAQILRWRQVFRDLFGEAALGRVRGFWLPEMGMCGEGPEALRLVRLLKECGYEWLILPAAALAAPSGWSREQLENRVHTLVVEAGGKREEILCAVRDTEMGIRQQSGQDARGCCENALARGRALAASGADAAALVVPTSDGENGNVMMFEFFPNSFAPLFAEGQRRPEIAFQTVSEYLDTHLVCGPTSEVRLKPGGGSWIGGHDSWNLGERRREILGAIERLSGRFAQIRQEGALTAEAERALLWCETSCFVYWDSPFWADQARRCLEWAQGLPRRGVLPRP